MSSTNESTNPLKKPQTAYFMWFAENREKIVKIVGSKDLKLVGTKAGELWKKLSAAEKLPFEKEVKRQKDAYDAFVATPEGQKALEQKKAEKKEEKQAKEEKEAEKAKEKEEKDIARERRACAAAVKAVEKNDKLKRPLTAYFMWLNENRDRIASMVGGGKGSEVSKKGGEMWKKLSEKDKKPFEDRAKKEKEEYDAYIGSKEGQVALKAYKEATSAVAYKEKVVEDEDNETLDKIKQKRKADVVSEGAEVSPKKKRSGLAIAGA